MSRMTDWEMPTCATICENQLSAVGRSRRSRAERSQDLKRDQPVASLLPARPVRMGCRLWTSGVVAGFEGVGVEGEEAQKEQGGHPEIVLVLIFSGKVITGRKPILRLRYVGTLPLRWAERTTNAGSPNEPPRN